MATGHVVFSLQPYHSDFNPKILLILLAKLQQPGGFDRSIFSLDSEANQTLRLDKEAGGMRE